VAVTAASGCGASPKHASASAVTVLMARAPNSLDPAVGAGAEATEADWLAYTPLLTYAHAAGVTGTRLIPGLATDLPTITDGGTTYQLTLRAGLVYSNGRPVKASDFSWAVERAIRLRWPGATRLLVGHIVGAAGFASGRARTISGIQVDNETGQITIRLGAADGEFDDVLALPALAPVPSSTPLRDEQASPPPGVGPYRIVRVISGRSFELVRNPRWAQAGIPGIPAGRVDLDVSVSPDRAGNAVAVLHDKADVLDPDNANPRSLLGRVKAPGRYLNDAEDATYAILLSATGGPFSSELARQAVVTALDGQAIARLADRGLTPGCYLLPAPMAGHPSASCPYGRPTGPSKLAAARALVKRSGWSGTAVTVSGAGGAPASALTSYCVALLDRIGFRARASRAPDPQSAVELLTPQLPDPAAMYGPLSGTWALEDPSIARRIGLLSPVPAAQLSAVSTQWAALDEYAARKAYVAVLGYPILRILFSGRIDAGSAIYQPVMGLDWSSLALR
jgi:peptide/nickel transport system substrate-binding protein